MSAVPCVSEHSNNEGGDLTSKLKALQIKTEVVKRTDYIQWDEYFMAVAFLTAMRSKDPCSQVGACIVNKEKRIVGVGYNGMPTGITDEDLPWRKEADDPLETKYMYVCHAEMNAIMNKNSTNLAGCTMYVALFPCNECAKLIIQAGIKEVIFLSDKHMHKPETVASKLMMDMAGVLYRQYTPTKKKIALDFMMNNGISENSVETIEDSSQCNTVKSKDSSILIEGKRDINKKREDYLAWGEYFMALATLSALRSKDPSTQVGACIVTEANKIVGIGYNGMPQGCSDDVLPWGKSCSNKLHVKYMYVCHAEVNAVMNKNCGDVYGCTIYVALFPCNECAKIIIQAGIKKIVYLSDKYKDLPEVIASKKMLDLVGIPYVEYNLPRKNVLIDFDTINWNSKTS